MTKEFLSNSNVDFINVDVENDPGGREQLLRLGTRNIPCLAKGKKFIIAKNLEEVAQFVGVPGPGFVLLPPGDLFKKWINALRTAQRYVRQIPNDQFHLSATDIRARPTRKLSFHIFCIAQTYLECVTLGIKNMEEINTNAQVLPDGTFKTGDEVARYGDNVIADLEHWWNGLADKSCQQNLEINLYGTLSMHQLLNRCTWHSAHHTRQIADLLGRLNIKPDGPLDIAGLPLPKRIWD